jgi:hypothetical protein
MKKVLGEFMNTSQKVIVNNIREKLADRRDFVQMLGLASAGLGAFIASAQTTGNVTDVDILQFALNLEYLEAEFYTYARQGKTIDQVGTGISGSGNAGATNGGKKVTFIEGSTLAKTVDEIAANERAHVALLRNALNAAGTQPVAKPAINLNALGSGFDSQEDFIALARAFEDVGVSAYAGAAPLIQSKDYLGVAARILAAEAEHSGNLRLHAALYNVKTTSLDAVDVTTPPSGTQFFSLDSNGLAATRTPGQVLYIIYGNGSNRTNGGFFPNGSNGNLNTSGSAATPPSTTP